MCYFGNRHVVVRAELIEDNWKLTIVIKSVFITVEEKSVYFLQRLSSSIKSFIIWNGVVVIVSVCMLPKGGTI